MGVDWLLQLRPWLWSALGYEVSYLVCFSIMQFDLVLQAFQSRSFQYRWFYLFSQDW